jgi:hypothetical protein
VRIRFAVLGVVIKGIDDAGTGARSNGDNAGLDPQLAEDFRSIVLLVKGAFPLWRRS